MTKAAVMADPGSPVFYYIGLGTLAYVGFRVLLFLVNFVRFCLMRHTPIGQINLRKLGKWAVVTGATDGIGKAYAEKIAKKGLNVVIISRNQEKLDACEKEIREKTPGIDVKTVAVDFSKSEEIYDKITEKLKGLEIGLLVNNVGLSYPYPEVLTDVPNGDKLMSDMINVNCLAMVRMCQIVLPGMIARKKGQIVNLSSGSAIRPMPLLAVYSATKAFVISFSQGLQAEYGSFGIRTTCVTPFYVATKMSGLRGDKLLAPSAPRFADSSLALLAWDTVTCGYWPHDVQAWFMRRLPDFIYFPLVLNQMKTVRDKTLRKLKRQS